MRKFLSLLLFCCLLTSGWTLRAQQTLGSLNGTVLDSSGAAVPGSTVTATDSAIGVTRTTKAQSNGFFQIFNLPVGTYSVKATHEGFETTELTGVEVQEAGAKTLNLSLKVGQIAESVTVTATPLLNATDATNGYTLDKAQIALTPLATGSFTQLAVLSPGVSAELLANLDTNSGLGKPADLGQWPTRYLEYVPGKWCRRDETFSTARAQADRIRNGTPSISVRALPSVAHQVWAHRCTDQTETACPLLLRNFCRSYV